MANVERGVVVAGALNRYVRRVYDYKVGFDKPGTDALLDAADAITAIVADINQPAVERSDFTELVDSLTTLTNAVQTDGDQQQPVAAAAEAVVEPEPEEIQESGYDAEIAAIFSEEAAELLEAADQALSNWSKDKNSEGHIEELKRHLHTLKGGARMSGITAMGPMRLWPGKLRPTRRCAPTTLQPDRSSHLMQSTSIRNCWSCLLKKPKKRLYQSRAICRNGPRIRTIQKR